ncbi:hypothetical protein C8J57DRAFT_1715156 [Mycena rebaudengoi]|nr:hypothetical protein C8J57DRAFT_1715156 [Mycena rebaudengoi]
MDPEEKLHLAPHTLSPFFIGSSLNLVLFTLELFQAKHYFESGARRRDSVFIKLGVGMNLFTDLLGTLACSATTYYYVVTSWGNLESLEKQYWPVIGILFTIAVVTAVSQFFMISRYWQITKHHAICLFLLVALVGAVVGILGGAILLVLAQDDDTLLNDFIFLALTAAAVGDIIISVLLFWQLFSRINEAELTRWNFFQRLICSVIETGTLTAVVTVLGFATWVANPHGTNWIPFTFIQARMYSCAMLFLLNNRKESKSIGSGNAAEAAVEPIPEDIGDVMMFAKSPVRPIHPPPFAVMDDSDAFRLTKMPIDLNAAEWDSDSDISKNLNDELRDMHGNSRSRSTASFSSESSVEFVASQAPSRSVSPRAGFRSPRSPPRSTHYLS